jgi:serine protease AprX
MFTPRRRLPLASLSFAALLVTALVPQTAVAAPGHGRAADGVSVIVRAAPGRLADAGDAIRRAGGTVDGRIAVIHAYNATVPASALWSLTSAAGVADVSENVPLRLLGAAPSSDQPGTEDLGSLESVRRMIGADAYWDAGFDGEGIDVAVIDSGVAPVLGLSGAGAVISGPDLSFESQDPDLRYLDTYGHGTHMAGIIAGNDGLASGDDEDDEDDSAATPADDAGSGNAGGFRGVAPGARIVSLKVADAFGTTDLSQVLAAIDWVVKHRHDHSGPVDLNIRVLNLSFGTDGTQAYTLDPLAFAVEQAWQKGIFVVVAGGNEGYGTTKLNNPAYDPYVMAVGASDPQGTLDTVDDVVAEFSSRGDSQRHPDLVAPGKSIVSLRDPGSFIDTTNPGAVVGSAGMLFRGSGTSQATAVVSGAAALVLQQRPKIKPDELKALLTSTADDLSGADPAAQGAGLLDLAAAFGTTTPKAKQTWPRAKGNGSLEKARGSHHVADGDDKLKGEQNIFGDGFDAAAWAGKSGKEGSWKDGSFLGRSWTGRSWTSTTWLGLAWKGRSWTSGSWTGRSWTSDAWTGRSWTSSGWSGGTWTGRSWTAGSWTGRSWSSAGWGT